MAVTKIMKPKKPVTHKTINEMKLNHEKYSLNQKEEGKIDTKNTQDKQETSGQQIQPQLHQ